jgi:hypothetical protein
VVTLTGMVDRWSATDITQRLTRQVAGVVDVINKLSFEYDDREAYGVGLAYGIG